VSVTQQLDLTLPAQPEFVGVARLTLAGLASRLGLDIQQVEDVKVAVAEAMTLLLGAGDGGGAIQLSAQWDDGRLEIVVSRGGSAVSLEREEAAIAMMVMEAMMDEARLEPLADRPCVRLSKARASA